MRKNKDILLNLPRKGEFIEVFRLEEIEDNRLFANYRRYDFYQLMWVTRANGDTSYSLDFNEYKLEDNQLIFIFPGQIDRMNPDGKQGFLYTIHNEVLFRINQHLQSDYLNGYLSNLFLKPDENLTQTLQRINSLILDEYNTANRLPLMESYMQVFLFHLSSLTESVEGIKKNSDPAVADLMKLIDKHFIQQRETNFYAEILGLTNKTVNEICKKGTGKTVKQHLQERLVLEMKKEIRLGRKSLKEISFELGFSEPAYFTRFFKHHTSMTPSEFKEN